jgi:hypothetical protein
VANEASIADTKLSNSLWPLGSIITFFFASGTLFSLQELRDSNKKWAVKKKKTLIFISDVLRRIKQK